MIDVAKNAAEVAHLGYKPGKSYKITLLRDISTCQANNKPAKVFELKKGQVLKGEYTMTTAVSKYSGFKIAELEDEVYLPHLSFKTEELKNGVPIQRI